MQSEVAYSWEINQPEPGLVKKLQQELRMEDSLFARLFVNRGIHTFEQAEVFVNPTLEALHDPFLMKGMEDAVERINVAIENGEDIVIYGDYDVDGTTSVALVYGYLRALTDQLSYYVPNRYKEGYGISIAGVDWAAQQGATLMIALDCGIKAIEQAAHAKGKGIDLIICDHHLPGEVLPEAYAILDPKQGDCPYPFKELSGCGIGFKLLQALAASRDLPKEILYHWMDLPAISIACDIVPILGENRVLTYFGLEKINKKPLPGVNELLSTATLERDVNVTDLVFRIGPRINAAGRMDDAKHAVKMLLGEAHIELGEQAQLLETRNTQRKELDRSITESAHQQLLDDEVFDEKRAIVVFDAEWHKGVIGIVASRLVDRHYKPAIVLTEDSGMITGSARSVRGFNIYKALEACEDLLDQYGGHKFAAGLKMNPENLEAFKTKFEEVVQASITEDSLQPVIHIDAELDLDRIYSGKRGIESRIWQNLKRFEPFGPSNMKPVFLTPFVRDIGEARIVGDNHLRCAFRTGTGHVHYAIGFGLGHKLELLQGPVDICYTLEENHWNGNVSLQLNLKDLRKSA